MAHSVLSGDVFRFADGMQGDRHRLDAAPTWAHLKVMRFLLYLVILVLVLLVAAAIYLRVAPLDAEALHVDPAEVTPPATPNHSLMAGTSAHFIQTSPEDVATRIAAVADADGGRLLAGAIADGHVTYVVRSRLFGFPDIVSLRWRPENDGTELTIFSRSIYGYSDLGVNTRRAHRWSQAARGASVFSDGD